MEIEKEKKNQEDNKIICPICMKPVTLDDDGQGICPDCNLINDLFLENYREEVLSLPKIDYETLIKELKQYRFELPGSYQSIGVQSCYEDIGKFQNIYGRIHEIYMDAMNDYAMKDYYYEQAVDRLLLRNTVVMAKKSEDLRRAMANCIVRDLLEQSYKAKFFMKKVESYLDVCKKTVESASRQLTSLQMIRDKDPFTGGR